MEFEGSLGLLEDVFDLLIGRGRLNVALVELAQGLRKHRGGFEAHLLETSI